MYHSAVPFENAYQRASHFAKHGADCGAADEVAYEAMADAFLTGPMNATTNECTRPNRVDYLRFDSVSFHFGVFCVPGVFVRTLYPVNRAYVARRGGPARFFTYECTRRM